jgi:protein-disulfide isomerase
MNDEAQGSSRTTRRLALCTLVIGAGAGTGTLLGRSRLFRRPPKPFIFLTPARNGQRVDLAAAPADAPLAGDAKAPVSLVLFSDLECPMSRQHAATLDRLLADYPGRANLMYRHYPLSDGHQLVARAIEAAREQGKFWELYRRLCAGKGGVTRDQLLQAATALGLDPSRFTRSLDGEQARARVNQDAAAARMMGITGTPTTFVNGRLLVGAEPYQAVKKLVDAELGGRPARG